MKKNLCLILVLSGILISVVSVFSPYSTAVGAENKKREVCMPTQVKASHILVPTKQKAITIREEILSGMDFAEAAENYSECPSGRSGGDLGFFSKGQMVPEFEHEAFVLPVGEVSEPVQTQFGWHLILVTDKK